MAIEIKIDGLKKGGNITLIKDGDTLHLSWANPIKLAYLVTIDQCILRIDYNMDGKIYSCFPKVSNYNEIIDPKKRANVVLDWLENGIIYRYGNT